MPRRAASSASRLRRDRERWVARYGADAYETALAGCALLVDIMLGKLEPTVYVLRRDA